MDISYYKKYEPIFGKWHIVRELGEGSFGKVFEIERRDFGGTYKAALKAITIPQSQSEVKDILASGMDEQSVTSYFRGFVEEMIAEFVLMSKLKGNSNIVSYEDHDVIQHAEGIGWDIFIRMELLTPLLDYTRKSDLSRSDVIKLGIDICKALEVCRKNNIIHRDIKPQNIFISDLGDFKLGDFGIARTVEKTMGGLSKKGTYHYMAPEVFKSEPYGASVDIYSLGIVLYRFMNNNRLPFFPPFPSPIKFSDSDAALARRMKGETIPAPANADEALSQVILKACAYSPEDRYLSPSDMRRDLEALLDGRSIDVSSSEKTVGVFCSAAEPTDKKEPVSETAAFFAEPLPTASDVGTVGIFSGNKTALKDETVGIFNSGKASSTEPKVSGFDTPKNPLKRQAPRSFAPTSESDKKALMDAIENEDISAVSQLLSKGVDPNCELILSDGSRISPLFYSIFDWPNDEIAKLLIDAGADVNYIDDRDGVEVPLLFYSVWLGSSMLVEYLLRNGADPNRERIMKDGSRYSPLIDSIRDRPNTEIPKMLIEAGADVNYRSINGALEVPVLSTAISESNVDILKLLLSKGADPNCERVLADGSRYSPLLDSVHGWPNDTIASILINAGADVNYIGNVNGAKLPVLSTPICAGNIGIVERLLSKGADPNCERVLADGSRYSLLLDSISVWPNDEITKLLIGAGADVNYVGFANGVKFPVLHAAISESNIGIVERLLSKGADPNCERVLADGSRYSPLLDSIHVWPNDTIASILINAGADVNYIGFADGVKFSVLHAAIIKSNVDILKLLLSKGADPNCERVLADGSRYSPLLDSITEWPNDEITKLLIGAGADVNYVGFANGVKLSVLHVAMIESNMDILKLLLSKGADPYCEGVFNDGSRSSVLRDCILHWPNAQIIDLLCSYMNPLPDDVRGLKVKRSGLSEQTIKKLKAAGCKVKMF
ncbi:MAG: ankyrin repeat domain-containing protein [Oscillospiraceae bacterium]|nr:ankyrin repeat domain-containing protein [Oscillospiraceae bacterium]